MKIFEESEDLLLCLAALMPSAESPDEVADQITALCQMLAIVIGNHIKSDRIDDVAHDLMDQVAASAHVISGSKGVH